MAEVLGIVSFDEEDLYAALDDLRARQDKIEKALWRNYLAGCGAPPAVFLYDVTSSYLEDEHNDLGEFGYPPENLWPCACLPTPPASRRRSRFSPGSSRSKM